VISYPPDLRAGISAAPIRPEEPLTKILAGMESTTDQLYQFSQETVETLLAKPRT
jgi:hypothetical protein